MQASVQAEVPSESGIERPMLRPVAVMPSTAVPKPASEASSGQARKQLLILASIAVVYLVWGSTFLAMRWVVAELPPLGMSGARGLIAGLVLHLVLRLRGVPAPTRSQWLSSAVIGLLFLPVANGSVAYAERTLSSGFASVGVAASPLFAALLAWGLGERPRTREMLGLLLGLIGIGCLSVGSGQHAVRMAVVLVLLVSPLGSAIGALASRKLPQPPALMAASAQLLTGGAMLLTLSTLVGERWPAPAHVHSTVWLSLAYLIVFGSLIGYSCYAYLLQNTRLSLAMSCSYVNPIIAVLLGALVGHETVRASLIAALLLVVAGVAFIVTDRHGASASKESTSDPTPDGQPSPLSPTPAVPLPLSSEPD